MPAGISAYTALANVTLTSTASTVTFSSINQTYRDLILVWFPIGTAATNDWLRFNSDSGSNYNSVFMAGNGSATSSTATASSTQLRIEAVPIVDNTATAMRIAQIMDYSVTDKHKCVLARSDNAARGTEARSARWASNSAITSIQVGLLSSTFAAGSTFALYGVSA
jgi:hypothetical protein